MTPQQQRCLSYIRDYIADHDGVAPSYAEIAVNLGMASKQGIHRLISALESRGYLTRVPTLARSIRLADSDDASLLSPRLLAKLHAYCARTGERPDAVVCELVGIFLGEEEGGAIATRAAEASP